MHRNSCNAYKTNFKNQILQATGAVGAADLLEAVEVVKVVVVESAKGVEFTVVWEDGLGGGQLYGSGDVTVPHGGGV